MSKCKIIDTFPEFLAFWEEAKKEPIDRQIERWASIYMSEWPELLEKQKRKYSREGFDWKEIAREKVFPFLNERLPAMREAHTFLLELCPPIYDRARKEVQFESDVIFVIYVGIGCGAGWADSFDKVPAVLFGVENIAECGWNRPEALSPLIAHEIGHLMLFQLREKESKSAGSGPFWQLFSEGFARRCEHMIIGKETWPIGKNQGNWLDWCQEHKSWLAAEFLKFVDAGEPVRPFFGSWFEIRGRKQCGYFLGHELIKGLEEGLTFKEIALLDDIDDRFRCALEKVAGRADNGMISLA